MEKSVTLLALIASICFVSSENIVGEVMGNQLLRSPVAVILQITPEAIYHTKTLLGSVEALPDRPIIFYTVSRKGYEQGTASTFAALSESLSDFNGEESGSTAETISAATSALAKLPFDSAIILALSTTPSDLRRVDRFAAHSIRQRSRVYVIWTGREEMDSRLRETALKTGGAIYNAITDSVTRDRKLRINPADTVAKNQTESTENDDDDDDDEEDYPDTESEIFPDDVIELDRVKRQLKTAEVIFPEAKKINNDTNSAIVTFGRQKSSVIIPIVVELASGSNLEIRPSAESQLTFDVINNINQVSSMSFLAIGHGVAIRTTQPSTATLLPMDRIKVQVSFMALPQTGGSGKVSFSANGVFGRVTRSTNVYVTTTPTTDNWEPELTYRFKGDCRQFDKPSNCENGQWSLDATFKDPDSGLLKILSEPVGLLFSEEFVAGTRSPVSVTYLASCCKPKVDIWAEDVKGNFRKKSFDVFHPVLLDGEIAAVVLAIILLIVIIALIIISVLYCRKRKSKWDITTSNK